MGAALVETSARTGPLTLRHNGISTAILERRAHSQGNDKEHGHDTATESVTKRPAWKALEAHHQKVRELHLRELFAEDPKRGERMAAEAAGVYLDYSKNRVTDETLRLLVQLAEESGLRGTDRRHVPRGEDQRHREPRRAARGPARAARGIHPRRRRRTWCPRSTPCSTRWPTSPNRVRSGAWKGHTGKRIRNVVNIGIGGSDLGPVMAYEALKHYSDRAMTFRFVSNVDGTDFVEAVRDLDPAETLFIVSSKTFTTLETMTNAHSARAWSLAGWAATRSRSPSTSSRSRPTPKKWPKFGIDTDQHVRVLGLGRRALLDGLGDRPLDHARHRPGTTSAPCSTASTQMDEHFRTAPFEQNLPVLMGLLAVWYNDFFGAQTVAVLPYEQYLKRFPAYLQQLTMESNGKHVTLDGEPVDYDTGPIYWGEPGTNGQHSFYQLIHQGTRLIPCDFIAFGQALNPLGRAPRHAAGERLRPGRGARLRQDPRGGQGRRDARLARAAPGLRGQPALQHPSAGAADAGGAGQAGGALRA